MHLTSAAELARPGAGSGEHALAETARRLGEVNGALSFAPAEPVGPGWTPLARLTDADVRAWLDRLTTSASGHRAVGASYLILRLTGCVATPAVAAALLHDRGLPIDDEHAAVHLDGDQFDSFALPSGSVEMLPDDPLAGSPGTVVVDDRTVLADRVAGRLFAVLEPVIQTVSRHARYSARTMWGSVADRLAGPAVLVANAGGVEPAESWERVSQIIDRLAERAPIRRRPRPIEITWSGGIAAGTVKGTCCLKYVECDLRPRDAAHQPQEFCGGCPYVSDDIRVANRRAALEARFK